MVHEIEQISTNASEIIKNIDYYADKFINQSVFGFKKIYLSEDEQLEILTLLGDRLNWVPNSKNKIKFSYTEDHSKTIENRELFGENDVIIDWHLEHINYQHAQVSGMWNMKTFTCAKTCGKTGFVDTVKIYEDMPKDWQLFLQQCEIINYSRKSKKYGPICLFPDGRWFQAHKRNAIHKHPNKEEFVARLDTRGDEGYEIQELILVDGIAPTNEEIKLFSKISQFFINEVWNNTDRQMWWEWDEGDTIVHDAFSLSHSARGGFSTNERIFVGMWGFPNVEEVIKCNRKFTEGELE